MTDLDVVERVAGLWKRAVVSLRPRQACHKASFATAIKGADAIRLMVPLRRLFSSTRQTQIDAAIAPVRTRTTDLVEPFATRNGGSECAIAWLAGLLEGEAWFGIARRGDRAYPAMSLEMTSLEVVQRAQQILGTRPVRARQPAETHWDVTFKIARAGDEAAEWMRTLRPWMGQRRANTIDAALAAYDPIRLVDSPERCVVEIAESRIARAVSATSTT